ncbi:MAG TPA: GTPase ObgE [Terriglobia bacterium]|nr:GTPase ObgE [Terriglobia bacterium]
MFIDEAKITVHAGDGGHGCIAFRREKFVPRGGPSGGDGGNGGSIYLVANDQENTLLKFRYNHAFRANRGRHGEGSNKHGKSGDDLEISVPLGTVVFDFESGDLLHDFTEPRERVLIASGGKGGHGNAHFASSVNRAPSRAQDGRPGEQKTLRLELKLLADVGLVGFPNAGKSTLISSISAARPKIADYPFTTLEPHLGVVAYDQDKSFVVADIPGLIEGAHLGHGLGIQVLRHIERTRLLLHLVDVSAAEDRDPVADFKTIEKELAEHNSELTEKPRIVVATKLDAADPAKLRKLQQWCRQQRMELIKISSVTGEGLEELKHGIIRKLSSEVPGES